MNEFQEGYEFARRYSTRKKVEVVSEPLPFRVSTKEEIYAKLESLKTQMRVEPVGMEEGALLLLETNLPWRISPETNLARLHAEQYQLGKYEQKRKDNNPEAWRELAPIHHEAARVTAEKKWSSIQDTITKLVTSNSTE